MMWTTLNQKNWGPWDILNELQREVDRAFALAGGPGGQSEFPRMNVWTNDDCALIRAELPGIKPDDFELSVQDDTVTIHSRRQGDDLEKTERRLRNERGRGDFTRTLSLPFRVDADSAQASYLNGILEIRLPRAESDKPRKITVNAS